MNLIHEEMVDKVRLYVTYLYVIHTIHESSHLYIFCGKIVVKTRNSEHHPRVFLRGHEVSNKVCWGCPVWKDGILLYLKKKRLRFL